MADKKKNLKREPLPKDLDKEKAVADALKQIEKDFGKGAIMKLGQSADMSVETIPTGSVSLDLALGVGGLPKGRIVEIYGPESSGKTTVALHCIAQAQKLGGTAAFIDAEHALDPAYAKILGVDIDNLLVSQPDNGEQALDITDKLVRSGGIDIIVVDSVAALTPRSEIEGEMGDVSIGLQARLMSQALRKLAGHINWSKSIVIFINQLRASINNYGYGPNETTTGGRALKFYASVRLDVRKKETIKQGDTPIGHRVAVKVVKNKVSPPFKTAKFDIMYGKGISRSGEVIDVALDNDIIKKAGGWFTLPNGKRIQGRENLRDLLDTNEEEFDQVYELVKDMDSNDKIKKSKEDDDFDDEVYELEDESTDESEN